MMEFWRRYLPTLRIISNDKDLLYHVFFLIFNITPGVVHMKIQYFLFQLFSYLPNTKFSQNINNKKKMMNHTENG